MSLPPQINNVIWTVRVNSKEVVNKCEREFLIAALSTGPRLPEIISDYIENMLRISESHNFVILLECGYTTRVR